MLFRCHQLLYIIIKINHCHWLHKYGGAAGRLVMDNTRKILTVFLFYRYHITVTAHGDNGILKIFLILRRVKNVIQMVLDTCLRCLHLATNTLQFHTGIITKITMLIHSIFQIALQFTKNLQTTSPIFENRGIQLQFLEELLYPTHGIHGSEHIHDFRGFNNGTDTNFLHQLTNITDTTQRWISH